MNNPVGEGKASAVVIPAPAARPTSPPSPAASQAGAPLSSGPGILSDNASDSRGISTPSLIDIGGASTAGIGGEALDGMLSGPPLSSVKLSASSAAVSAMEAGGIGMRASTIMNSNVRPSVATTGASGLSQTMPPAEAAHAQHISMIKSTSLFGSPTVDAAGSAGQTSRLIDGGVVGGVQVKGVGCVDQEALVEAVTSRVVEVRKIEVHV